MQTARSSSEFARPVSDLGAVTARAHEVALRGHAELQALAASQYAVMGGGQEHLARLVEAVANTGLGAALCSRSIHLRTEVLLYEDADTTPASSRECLTGAVDRLLAAADGCKIVAHHLSRRLASAAARSADQKRIADALSQSAASPSAAAAPTTTPSGAAAAGHRPPVATHRPR
ncbi:MULTISPECIES: hypothetical protein [Streptomyces]|uniref:Uncharacterized protein n=1 Tax=Streptomyces ramulosus TaxID=47762 RepID=A0ABW1FU00_9ACTN